MVYFSILDRERYFRTIVVLRLTTSLTREGVAAISISTVIETVIVAVAYRRRAFSFGSWVLEMIPMPSQCCCGIVAM